MTDFLSYFEVPGVLLLLVLAPLFPFLGRRSIAGLGPIRARLAAYLRIGVFALLVLALAGSHSVRRTDALSVIFLLDRSASVSAELQAEAEDFVRSAARSKRPGKDRVGVISFARDRSIEQPASDALRSLGGDSPVTADRTDLAAALRLAAALAPPDTSSRVIVLSDGNENMGQSLKETTTLSASGVPIDIAPLRYRREGDVVLERLDCPQSATQDEPIAMDVVLRAQRPTSGRIHLYHNDALISFSGADGDGKAGIPVKLEAGLTKLRINRPLTEPGFHRFSARFIPDRPTDDSVPENDTAQAFTIVGGRDRVLILTETDFGESSSDTQAARILSDALAAQNIESEVRVLPGFRLDPLALLNYSAVILSNVPASSLSREEQRALASYVQDQGGGLIAVGGDSAFCMGGYADTPLEAILPVETDRAKLNLLSLALVLVIDKSGSMTGEKIELAKKAAAGSVQLLSSKDKVGVIAFDFVTHWIVRLAPCTAKLRVIQSIARINADGGTNLFPAMEEAFGALKANRADTQHVLVLSDGHSVPGDFLRLARDMSKQGITISTVGVGVEADRALLRSIAETTGGRFYFTDSPKSIPRVFARETVLANRSGIVEERFVPRVGGLPDDPLLTGIRQEDLPPLDGYVIATPKGSADISLFHPREGHEDPILARWRAGLGKSIAFTGGMWPQWGRDWAAWPGFSKFWAQTVRWVARPPHSEELAITTHVDGTKVTVRAEATAQDAAGLASLNVAATVVGPAFKSEPLRFVQTGAGVSEATFDAADAGSYVVTLAYRYGLSEEPRQGVVHTGVSVGVSPEHRDLQSNEWLLEELARRTQGRGLETADAATVFRPEPMPSLLTRKPVWPLLLKIACVLFLIDVAVRRLAVDPLQALARARAWLRHSARWAAPATSAATVRSLKDMRGRMRRPDTTKAASESVSIVPVDEPSPSRPPLPAIPMQAPASGVLPASDDSPATPSPGKAPATPKQDTKEPPGEVEGTTTARLLRAKRRATQDRTEPRK